MKDHFQHQKNTVKHYQRILSAKHSVPQKPRKRSLCLRQDPIKKFQFNRNNQKLATKLIQIYSHKSKKTKKKRRKLKLRKSRTKSRQTFKSKSLISEYKKRQHQTLIDNSNLKMIQRLQAVKPTIGDWDIRERKLKTYRKLSHKSHQANKQEQLYKQFRKTLLCVSSKKQKSKRKF